MKWLSASMLFYECLRMYYNQRCRRWGQLAQGHRLEVQGLHLSTQGAQSMEDTAITLGMNSEKGERDYEVKYDQTNSPLLSFTKL